MDTNMIHINRIWWEIANTIRLSHFISSGVTPYTEEQLTLVVMRNGWEVVDACLPCKGRAGSQGTLEHSGGLMLDFWVLLPVPSCYMSTFVEHHWIISIRLYFWTLNSTPWIYQFSSVQSSHSVVSDSLRPHELQHTRPPCPSPSLGVHSDSWPSSPWCHPAISSSVVPFSSCPQSLPASESFPVSQLFAWGGQSTGASALASFLPKKSQGWSSEWTGWISLQSKGISRVFSNTTVQKHQFFSAQPSSQSNAHIHTWPLEKP